MNIQMFIIEWVISFIVLFFLMKGLIYLFQKKVNRVTATVFSFAILMLLSYVLSTYVYTFFNPEFIYVPILIAFLYYFVTRDK